MEFNKNDWAENLGLRCTTLYLFGIFYTFPLYPHGPFGCPRTAFWQFQCKVRELYGAGIESISNSRTRVYMPWDCTQSHDTVRDGTADHIASHFCRSAIMLYEAAAAEFELHLRSWWAFLPTSSVAEKLYRAITIRPVKISLLIVLSSGHIPLRSCITDSLYKPIHHRKTFQGCWITCYNTGCGATDSGGLYQAGQFQNYWEYI